MSSGEGNDHQCCFDDENNNNDERTPLVRNPSIRLSYGSPASLGTRKRPQKTSNPSSNSILSHPLRLPWTTNGLALVSVFFFSGIVFGWAPLKLILLSEGQYSETCNNTSNGAATTTLLCASQSRHFNGIFTAAQFVLSFASLPVGFLLDHCSKSLHYSLALGLQVWGLLLFGNAQSPTNTQTFVAGGFRIDRFVVAYSCMALGGCMTMLGAFPATFLVPPKFQPVLLASISCLFDASSIVFAIFAQLYKQNQVLFSRQHLFGFQSGLAVLVFVSLAVCWYWLERNRNWQTLVQVESDETNAGTGAGSDNGDNGSNSDKNRSAEEEYGITTTPSQTTELDDLDASHTTRIEQIGMHRRSVFQQLATLDFFVGLSFACVHMTRCNFYIQSVHEILLSYGERGTAYTDLFAFVLPSGIVFVPAIDWTIQKIGIVQTLQFTNLLGVVFGALLLVPSLHVQVFNFFVFTAFRAYLYAVLNTFTALTFGVATMGRMIGFTFTTAAVVTLLQYPAAAYALDYCAGNFARVNSLMLLACAIPMGMFAWYSKILATNRTKPV